MTIDWKRHFAQIYENDADRYDRLIGYEDRQGDLAKRIEGFAAAVTTVVDIGAGTGRLTVPLCRQGNQVHGVDASSAMLTVAMQRLEPCDGDWKLSVGDVRRLPVDTDWADGAIAGWVLGHLTEWHPDAWKTELAAALDEMDRVVRPGGIEVVVDTLGTAVAQPGPPNDSLAAYHEYLQGIGFELTVLQTDYEFPSVEEAIDLLDWFFGLGRWARQHNSTIVPEYTGWWERRTSPT